VVAMSLTSKKEFASLSGAFWLCRIVYIRFLAFVYLVAFAIALHQNEALLGPNGLTPFDRYIGKFQHNHNGLSSWDQFVQMPTIYIFISPTAYNLNAVAALGVALSLLVILLGAANSIMMTLLWLLYTSLVNVGQTWYSFGWESQLLESGFLAIFMVPLLSLERFPALSPTPSLNIWGNRWLIFRIMIGAGMIKVRGDSCWRDLTCMYYHYQTQPVPNPLSPFLHALPPIVHKAETMGNHLVELLLPWLLLVPLPRIVPIVGGLVQIVFQCILIFSGNLSFLNWLTILPCITCFDDESLQLFFSRHSVKMAQTAQMQWKNTKENNIMPWRPVISTSLSPWKSAFQRLYVYFRWLLHLSVFALICYRSQPVVMNLLSRSQAMNTSFDSFRIVNTYGAFGSITKIRHEVILQGAVIDTASKDRDAVIWTDYNFKCKPGDINRRPCFVSPYHYRLDWLMWFAAFQSYGQCPWLVHLAVKVLQRDKNVMGLLAPSNWIGNTGEMLSNVTHIRAQLYEYQYHYYSGDDTEEVKDSTTRSSDNVGKDILLPKEHWEIGTWWKRKEVRSYMPPVSLQDAAAQRFLDHHGWSSDNIISNQ
jgi:lipase maturation factor 1